MGVGGRLTRNIWVTVPFWLAIPVIVLSAAFAGIGWVIISLVKLAVFIGKSIKRKIERVRNGRTRKG